MIVRENMPHAAVGVEYPPPPRVHWAVLLLAWLVLIILIIMLAPPSYSTLLAALLVDAWAFRLCIWIRSLDADARSPIWCDVAIIVQLAYLLLERRPNRSVPELDILETLRLANYLLSLWTLYLIRSDLLRHYNQREPYGLRLGIGSTYLFSFLYIQAKLYPIARAKEREARERTGAAIPR